MSAYCGKKQPKIKFTYIHKQISLKLASCGENVNVKLGFQATRPLRGLWPGVFGKTKR